MKRLLLLIVMSLLLCIYCGAVSLRQILKNHQTHYDGITEKMMKLDEVYLFPIHQESDTIYIEEYPVETEFFDRPIEIWNSKQVLILNYRTIEDGEVAYENGYDPSQFGRALAAWDTLALRKITGLYKPQHGSADNIYLTRYVIKNFKIVKSDTFSYYFFGGYRFKRDSNNDLINIPKKKSLLITGEKQRK